MKFAFKWAFRILALLVVLFVVLLLSFDSIMKAMFMRQIREQTGMDVKIGKFSIGLLSPVITIEDFKLYNPAEFGGTPFLDIRELHIEYNRTSLAHRNLRCNLLRLDIAELCVVKNESGITNLLAYQGTKFKSKRADDFDFGGIQVLNLSVGKLSYLDLKKPARNREFNINLKNQVFKDIKTPGDLYAVLIMIWLRTSLVQNEHQDFPTPSAGSVGQMALSLRA